MNASLQHKTIRPGSLNGYAYYYSDRRPVSQAVKPKRAKGSWRHKVVMAVVVLVAGFGLAAGLGGGETPKPKPATAQAAAAIASAERTPTVAEPVDVCAGNSLDKLVKVSITQRKLWACEGKKTVHEAPVITGKEGHEETHTPTGTYQTYGKTTDTTLSGTDSRGSWNYPVYYWMPFHHNQHGTYGFHDATWRPDSDFGNVNPYSDQASHGCLELTKASAKWLYEWAPENTTVTIAT